jgi:hypothetical protein
LVEIFPDIKGVDFDAAWERRVESALDPDTGLKTFLISRDDLITAKLATERPQDVADVEALRKAAQPTKRKPPEPTESGPNQ